MQLLKELLILRRPHGGANERKALSIVAAHTTCAAEFTTVLDGVGLEIAVPFTDASAGPPTVMFTAHVDTVHWEEGTQGVFQFPNGNIHADKDGKACVLGADDAAGCYILVKMIQAKVPGLYLFFIGEEAGGVGSSEYSIHHATRFKHIKQCVSFDRRGYHDVITKQSSGRCCSDEYARALSAALSDQPKLFYRPDSTGLFTDSANFTHLIPECTNISVGYFHEHSASEYLDSKHLMHLTDAAIAIDWHALPIHEGRHLIKDNRYSPWEEFCDSDRYSNNTWNRTRKSNMTMTVADSILRIQLLLETAGYDFEADVYEELESIADDLKDSLQ